eukprot:GHVT01070044.1.p1 GENE.GHVT01070044.1~~GHVT01070044.1.p1  ORF type:complete len:131 (+),score=32.51 GHVT01070044.1:957-1349(+)
MSASFAALSSWKSSSLARSFSGEQSAEAKRSPSSELTVPASSAQLQKEPPPPPPPPPSASISALGANGDDVRLTTTTSTTTSTLAAIYYYFCYYFNYLNYYCWYHFEYPYNCSNLYYNFLCYFSPCARWR